MRIVHIIYSFNTGGSETMLIDIINRQAVSHEVSLIVINNSYDVELLNKISINVNKVLLNRNPGSHSFLPLIKLNYKLLCAFPDVIHIHSYTLSKIILKGFDNIWYTAHALNIPMTYAKHLKGIIAISEAVANDIGTRCNKKVEVIPNGIDVSTIERRKGNDRHVPFKMVQVGRLDHEIKGQDILIRAVKQIVDKYGADITVDFIGTGPSESYLKKIVSDLNLENHVNFLGKKDREYIYRNLKNYDLMCHPARQEGFGLTVAEGMAAKLPVIVPMIGGPWEIISKGRYGIGVIPEDIESCAKAIATVKDNYSAYSSIVDDAYRHVVENYSIDSMVEGYINAYIGKL